MKTTRRPAKTRGRAPARKTTKRRSSPKQRPLHKRLALHPVSVLLLLCVGVLLMGITFHGNADTILVNAVVPAPLPTAPAVITAPADQTHFTSRPIIVKGTCQQNTYVKLSRNGVFSGVAICGAGQTTFEIATDLSLGSNVLLPQIYNVTDQAGPPSTPITVFFDNPPSPATAPPAGQPESSTPALDVPLSLQPIKTGSVPFLITTDFRYEAHVSGQPFDLSLGLDGGSGPFAVTIQWGDGTQSTFVRQDGSTFSATHTYTLTKRNQQTYLVRIEAVDNNGAAAFLEIAELVHAKDSAVGLPVIGDIGANVPPVSQLKQRLWLAWPAYGVVSVMTLSFWLGEQQEYYKLLPHRRVR